MDKSQAQVLEFHNTFGARVNRSPILVDDETMELRIALIEEEFGEFIKACYEGDLVEIADALGDLRYVIDGSAISYGIDLEPVVAEIHASNMSKLGEDGRPIYREDGKVLKGPNYFPPNIRRVLEEQS